MTDNTQTNPLYSMLNGDVNPDMTIRMFRAVSDMSKLGAPDSHLLIQSPGGFVEDGIVLFNILNNLPFKLYTYNGGAVQSIAVLIFLAGAYRACSATATFMIHRSAGGANPGTSPATMKIIADRLIANDIRVESILRQRITLTDAQWKMHAESDLHLTAAEALACGLVHEIKDFAPPTGSQVFNI
ncbi:MAG: ATP-dependent Clp protease proteolytic subunit [Glaciimonas sp.]|nr:ATP-dependent Clp protease proteolytic subunit [Glaciimonas sp.]